MQDLGYLFRFTLPRMRAMARCWTDGNIEEADEIVAKTLELAIEEVSHGRHSNTETWLIGLLVTVNDRQLRTKTAPSSEISLEGTDNPAEHERRPIVDGSRH